MKTKKRPQLPRGVHWKSDSPYIWFNWRDARGKQHQQSTGTADPKEALLFRLQFMQQAEEHLVELQRPRASYGSLPLKEVAKLYFDQKATDHAAGTIERERRMFRRIELFFGSAIRVKAIHLSTVQEYQQKRSAQVSPTMKRQLSARTINYELQLLRGVMIHAGCWAGDLAAYYKPLRQVKSKVGKAARNDQLSRIIATAKKNEYWLLAMYYAAVAAGTGCRACEIRNLQLRDVQMSRGRIRIRAEVAKNRVEREPRLMALAEWGLRELLYRAHQLGANEPEHYLLPLNLRKSRRWSKKTTKYFKSVGIDQAFDEVGGQIHAMELAAGGFGLALLPRSAARVSRTGVVFKSLADRYLVIETMIFMRRDQRYGRVKEFVDQFLSGLRAAT